MCRQAATLGQRWWVGGSLAVTLGALARAGFAYVQRDRALAQRNAALMAQSRFLADEAARRTKAGNAADGLLLALEALPDADSDDPIQRVRPYWYKAEQSLEA